MSARSAIHRPRTWQHLSGAMMGAGFGGNIPDYFSHRQSFSRSGQQRTWLTECTTMAGSSELTMSLGILSDPTLPSTGPSRHSQTL